MSKSFQLGDRVYYGSNTGDTGTVIATKLSVKRGSTVRQRTLYAVAWDNAPSGIEYWSFVTELNVAVEETDESPELRVVVAGRYDEQHVVGVASSEAEAQKLIRDYHGADYEHQTEREDDCMHVYGPFQLNGQITRERVNKPWLF